MLLYTLGLIGILFICLVTYIILDTTVFSYYDVKRENKESVRISFEDFIVLFKQISWKKKYSNGCFVDEASNSEIWCSNFIINGKHYIFKNYFEWLKWKGFYNNIVKYGGYVTNVSIVDEIKQYDLIKERLTIALTKLCNQLSIPLTYHDELGTAAGCILFQKTDTHVYLNNVKIQILNSYKDEPWVLAHELGHYFALRQREDNTEEGADKEALILCRSILNNQECKLLESTLNIYFGGESKHEQ